MKRVDPVGGKNFQGLTLSRPARTRNPAWATAKDLFKRISASRDSGVGRVWGQGIRRGQGDF